MTKTNFAWAAHAGLAYKVNQNFTVELAYRYLDLGSAITGKGDTFDGILAGRGRPFQFNDLTSHDIKLGVRWTCCDVPAAGARAVDPQGLIGQPLLTNLNGAGFSRAVLFCRHDPEKWISGFRTRSCQSRSVFRKFRASRTARDNDWLRLTSDDQRQVRV